MADGTFMTGVDAGAMAQVIGGPSSPGKEPPEHRRKSSLQLESAVGMQVQVRLQWCACFIDAPHAVSDTQ